MLWSIHSCQNRVSADQYHLTVSWAQASTHRGQCLLKLSADTLIVFRWSQAQVCFKIDLKYVVFMCCTSNILISNWPQTRKSSQLLRARKTVGFAFAYHGHVFVTLYVQFLCSDWWKFDRWVHAEDLCSILNLVYFDSWVNLWCFLPVFFPLDVQNEIQLLSGMFCYSWLVCLLGFWLRNMSLVEVGNPISDGIVFVFRLAWCVEGWKVWSDTSGLTWYLSGLHLEW